MLIRHINRGDVDAGGCPMCKPRHVRYEGAIPMPYLVEEGLEDYADQDAVEDGDSDFTVLSRPT